MSQEGSYDTLHLERELEAIWDHDALVVQSVAGTTTETHVCHTPRQTESLSEKLGAETPSNDTPTQKGTPANELDVRTKTRSKKKTTTMRKRRHVEPKARPVNKAPAPKLRRSNCTEEIVMDSETSD